MTVLLLFAGLGVPGAPVVDNTYFFQDGTDYTFQDTTSYDFN